MKKIYIAFLVGLSCVAFKPNKILISYKKINIDVKEPSDICVSPKGNTLYVVSDDGLLFETDFNGKVLREAAVEGVDFEGVYCNKDFVYVVDEFSRKVYQLNHADLAVVKTYHAPYSGGRNSAYEAITFNQKKGVFVLVTEKNPIWIREYDEKFNLLNEVKFTGVRDISAATFYNGYMWLLSDEDMQVLQLDASNYHVINTYKINVLNPEGLAFTDAGEMIICSDDLKRLYFYPKF